MRLLVRGPVGTTPSACRCSRPLACPMRSSWRLGWRSAGLRRSVRISRRSAAPSHRSLSALAARTLLAGSPEWRGLCAWITGSRRGLVRTSPSLPTMGVSGCSYRSMARPPRVRNRPDLANADANNRSGQARIGLDSLAGYVVPRAGKTDARGRCRTTVISLRICECVLTAVLGGLPPGSVPVVPVTRYGSGRGGVPFF
jgi:hypothetical protein